MAAEAPALDAAAGDVARADDDVGAVVERAHEVGQVPDVVREVGVHLEEAVVALGEPLLERLDVRRAEAELAGAVHDVDVRVARRRCASARSPVPSGESSSTTSRSASGTAPRTASTKRGRLSFSLYVGVTMSVRGIGASTAGDALASIHLVANTGGV